jgi:hypothetical protein
LFPEYDFARMNPDKYAGVIMERIRYCSASVSGLNWAVSRDERVTGESRL